MENEKIKKNLDSAVKRLHLLINELETAKETVGIDYEKYSEMVTRATLDSEMLCRLIRRIIVSSSVVDHEILMSQVCNVHGIYIEKDDDSVVIHLPPLPLKERSYTNCSFIVDPLLYALKKFCEENHQKKFEYAVVFITHVFPKETPARRIRDYDNIEVKKILDAIALHLLVDDNIAHCDLHHSSELSDTYETVIRITR